MKKVKLSMVDRAQIVDSLPKTGDVQTVKNVQSWLKELEMTPDEKEQQKSFNDIRDKDERDKAINSWYHIEKEMEVSDELFEFVKNDCAAKNESKNVSINESMNVYDQFK